jgi:hypothetical protein
LYLRSASPRVADTLHVALHAPPGAHAARPRAASSRRRPRRAARPKQPACQRARRSLRSTRRVAFPCRGPWANS